MTISMMSIRPEVFTSPKGSPQRECYPPQWKIVVISTASFGEFYEQIQDFSSDRFAPCRPDGRPADYPFTDEQLQIADMNDDTRVDVADIVMVVNQILET